MAGGERVNACVMGNTDQYTQRLWTISSGRPDSLLSSRDWSAFILSTLELLMKCIISFIPHPSFLISQDHYLRLLNLPLSLLHSLVSIFTYTVCTCVALVPGLPDFTHFTHVLNFA